MSISADSGLVCTIGYGNRTIGEFVDVLLRHEIGHVVDVRSVPWSRFNPDFRKAALKELLSDAGVGYVFMGAALGGRPRDADCYVDGKLSYSILAEKPEFLLALDRVMAAAERGMRLALMCSELRPEQCHRSKLIGNELEKRGVAVLHVNEAGRMLTNAQVTARLTNGQTDLFDAAHLDLG